MSDGQITRKGFLQLNQMEAEDNDEDLWITLCTMGYNNALVMDEVVEPICLALYLNVFFGE